MIKRIIAVMLTICLTAVTCYAEITAVQDNTTGNIVISGIDEGTKRVVAEVLKPDHKNRTEDVIQIVYLEETEETIVLPMPELAADIDGKEFTVRVNTPAFAQKWETQLRVYSLDTITEIVSVLTDGTTDEIKELLSDEEYQTILSVNSEYYNNLTAKGENLFAEAIETAELTDAEDFSTFYSENFGDYAVLYGSDAAISAKAFEEFIDSNIVKDTAPYEDYLTLSDEAKAKAIGLLQKALPEDDEEYLAEFTEAVLLALISDTEGAAEVAEILTEYKDVFGDKIDAYYDLKDTYSVDRKIAGEDYTLLTDLIADINSAINGSDGGGGGGGGGSRSGASYVGSTSTIKVGETAQPVIFSDLGDAAWAQDAVLYLYNSGIVNGKGDGAFAPNDPVLREEFVKMLTLAFDSAKDGAELPFTDVVSGSWYVPYISSAYEEGMVKGISETEFGIGQRITREDMAVMVYRYLTAEGADFSGASIMPFADKATVSEYARDAVAALSYASIVNGMSDGTFMPKETCNRAQAAQIIYNALKYIGGR